MNFSLIIPLYNESENVQRLFSEITTALSDNRHLDKYEVIYIDDASSDDTYAQLRQLETDAFRVFRVKKHGGQTAALAAGIKQAKYEILGLMDADLQSHPRDIQVLLDKLVQGYDCVTGCRRKRNDVFSKRFSTAFARKIRQKFLSDDFYDIGSPMKVFKKECVANLTFYDTFHRFIPVLIKMQGFKVIEVDVAHYPRIAGKSKYGISNRLWIGIKSMFAVRWMMKNWLDNAVETKEK
ncbi:MAG: glycosyltransferase [Candidatus Omnitrophota bacterium]